MPEVAGASVADRIAEGARTLRVAGVPRADRVAASIWAALGRSTPGEVWLRGGAPAPAEMSRRFLEAAARHAGGEPLAYAVGTAAFRSLVLEVDPRVLIPRPETEGLVDHVLAWGRARRGGPGGDWGIAVDLGTGSGALALSLAVEGRFLRVIATDLSPEALAVAAHNRVLVGPPVPVDCRLGSWLEPVDVPVDAIVANPPYVAESELAALDPAVRDYEPRVALLADEGGLGPTRCILAPARRVLRPGGLLAVEVDSRRAALTLALARDSGWTNARLAADAFGRDRYLLATAEPA